MFRKRTNKILPRCVAVGHTEKGEPYDITLPVDQLAAQDFNLGASRWPQNDITALFHVTTAKEYELVAARLRELQAETPNADKSVEQLIAEKWPRYAQLPSEIENVVEGLRMRGAFDSQYANVHVPDLGEDPPVDGNVGSGVSPTS